jgi:hypothetical protein
MMIQAALPEPREHGFETAARQRGLLTLAAPARRGSKNIMHRKGAQDKQRAAW